MAISDRKEDATLTALGVLLHYCGEPQTPGTLVPESAGPAARPVSVQAGTSGAYPAFRLKKPALVRGSAESRCSQGFSASDIRNPWDLEDVTHDIRFRVWSLLPAMHGVACASLVGWGNGMFGAGSFQ